MSDETQVYVELGLVSIAAGLVLMRLYVVKQWGKVENERSMTGKTVVITGGNSGLGKATAKELVKRGARVIIACRNEDSANQVVAEITKACKSKSSGEILFKHLDLSSFESVKRFATDITSNEKRLDVLINNAGVYQAPYELTAEGFETQFAVNHLSHALLTTLLLPKLKEQGSEGNPARVVNVISTHYVKGRLIEENFKSK